MSPITRGAADGAADGLRMVDHDVHRHGECAVVSQDHHPQGVPHEDQIDAGLVHDGPGGIIVAVIMVIFSPFFFMSRTVAVVTLFSLPWVLMAFLPKK